MLLVFAILLIVYSGCFGALHRYCAAVQRLCHQMARRLQGYLGRGPAHPYAVCRAHLPQGLAEGGAADFPPQPVITRDNVTMMIDTVVFFQVFDAKMYAYGVNRPIQAIENLSATTLRDIIGSMTSTRPDEPRPHQHEDHRQP